MYNWPYVCLLSSDDDDEMEALIRLVSYEYAMLIGPRISR